MTAVLTGNWNYPTKIISGPGRIAELGAICRANGITKPLVVTDKGLAYTTIISAVHAALKSADLPFALYAEVRGNPVAKNVDDGVAVYRAGAHDGVVAVGGGSGLDVGKAIAFMSARPARFGILKMLATGGPAQIQPGLPPSSPCRPRLEPDLRLAAPLWWLRKTPTRKRSSSIPK